jgi:hypothetical protein
MSSDQDIAPDALSVLRRDHRLAEELFAEYEILDALGYAPEQVSALRARGVV